jgi:uncharacterized protein (DUF1697 family)
MAKDTLTSYIALLRGINVGGNKKVPMADLKKLLEKNGYKDVKTLLASGNVIFSTVKMDEKKLEKDLEALLEKHFKFSIPVLIRTVESIQKLINANPFKGIKETPDTRLYITFLSEKPTSKLKIPYVSPGKEFKILSVSSTEIVSILVISEKVKTTEAMNILEKEYGKRVTTRNWNTVLKLCRK